MKGFFSTLFFSSSLLLAGNVIDSLDKALRLSKLYQKKILCFYDEDLSDQERALLAYEYFNSEEIYQSFSHTHIFCHTNKGEKGVSGFMVLDSSGKTISCTSTYADRSFLLSYLSGF